MLSNNFNNAHIDGRKFTPPSQTNTAKSAVSNHSLSPAQTISTAMQTGSLFEPSVSNAIAGFGKLGGNIDTSSFAVSNRVDDSVMSFLDSPVSKQLDKLNPALANDPTFAALFSDKAAEMI